MRGVRTALLVAVSLGCMSSASPEPIVRPRFDYYLDDTRHLDLADSVLEATRSKLQALLGDTIDYRPSVYITSDMKRFRELTSGSFPDWGAAAAVPVRRRMVLKSPGASAVNKPLEELLAHEYTHLVVNDIAGRNGVPRWFDEGMAMYASVEWSWSDNLAMSKAAVFGSFIPLAEVDDVNRFGEDKAHVAYAQSYLAVQYMLKTYGEQSIRDLLSAAATGMDQDGVILAATGSDYAGFQLEYEEYLKKHYNIASLFVDTAFIWIGMAVIVVVAGFVRYRRRRRYYKAWEEEEKLHSTDLDYGDPNRPEQPDDDEPWRS